MSTGTATGGTAGRTRSHRRVNILSTLTPEERQAFLQEQLDGMAFVRNLACVRHGLPTVGARNEIPPPARASVEEEEETTPAAPAGVSSEEVTRREDLARREGIVSAQQDLLSQLAQLRQQPQAPMAQTPAPPASSPPPSATSAPAPVQPQEKSLLSKLGIPAAVVAALGTGGLGYWLGQPKAPAAPNPPVQVAPVVSTDQGTVQTLNNYGYGLPRTDLGAALRQAMDRDPQLRQDILERARAALSKPETPTPPKQ